MASIFTKIRQHEIPGEIIYQDSTVFIILTIRPHTSGHSLVIPVAEEPDFQELPENLYTRLMAVTRQYAQALRAIYQSPKVALVAMGLEVAHTHLHVFPLYTEDDINISRAHTVSSEELKEEADKIRSYLKEHPIQ